MEAPPRTSVVIPTFQRRDVVLRSATRGGQFGGEDLDFGLRLLESGHRVVFNPDAISRQR
jgi:hypothetical protein